MISKELVIIGAGPSALATAIIRRARIFRRCCTSERLWAAWPAITDQIDNYPGFAEGIAGMKLSSELQGQAERFGAEIEYGGRRVSSVSTSYRSCRRWATSSR